MMATPVFVHACDYGLNESATPSLLSAQFGDGFVQDVADGINNMVEVWNVTFTRETQKAGFIRDDLKAYARVAQRFLWSPEPGLPQVLVKTEGAITYNRVAFGKAVVTATFKRVYEAF